MSDVTLQAAEILRGLVLAWAVVFAITGALGALRKQMRDRGLGVIIISHNMEDVRAVTDRIVVLRLGKNNGVFTADTSHQDLVAAITGAAENSVSRRQGRLAAEAEGAPT